MSWDLEAIYGLADCPRESLMYAARAYVIGTHDGREDVLRQLEEAGRDVIAAARPVLAWPDWDAIRGRREPDFSPCPAKCRKCARCVCSLSYWARGGRQYLGAEAKHALQQQASDA